MTYLTAQKQTKGLERFCLALEESNATSDIAQLLVVIQTMM
jgi:hypothetical protein